MVWLVSQPVWLLIVGCLAIGLVISFVARWGARVVIPPSDHEAARGNASALMTAFAGAFALLTALTLANEATSYSSSQAIISSEAGDAASLAWASTGHELNPAPIQSALDAYLQATRTYEWHGDTPGGDDPPTAQALDRLERAVRLQASKPRVANPTSIELLTSLDALTDQRRMRLAAASHELPTFYVLMVVITGVALIVNTSVVGLRSGLRPHLAALSLTMVIGLSLALLFALASPFRGTIEVSGHPIDAVIHDLANGYFHI